MEEKRDQEQLKHVCKLCNKRYPSGKSLGGHMRSHVIANSHKHKPIPQKVVNFDYDDEDDNEDEDEDEDDNEIAANQIERDNGNDGKQSGYGLRENPKKTWRLVGSPLKNNNSSSAKQVLLHYQPQQQHQQQERVCKQCGKGFQSLKALCGHMSSHADKERNFKEEDDYSWSSDSKEQLIIATESHSGNNNNNNNIIINNNCKRQTRSSLSRYKSLTTVDSLSPTGNGGGSSSNHSEIDQHEQEEVAMCLMMLSRDSSAHKPCFNFTTESSDNNSVILEGGASNYVGIVGNNKRRDLGLIKDNNKKKKIKQVIAAAKEEEEVNVNHEMDNSDSGYFENGAKELESDDSVDGFARNYGFKKPKNDFGSRLIAESFNYEEDDSRKSSRIRGVGNLSFDSPESDENNSSKKIRKQNYKKGYTNSSNNIQNQSGSLISTKRGSKYECWVCNKSFKSHQALGGHIISHRKDGENNLVETKISAKKEVAIKMMPSKAKKVKGHKCPYCPKVFKSGQALGGHKRSHMMGGGSNFNPERVPPPRPDPKQQPPLIDLNLPAPMEEEGSVSGSGSGSGSGG